MGHEEEQGVGEELAREGRRCSEDKGCGASSVVGMFLSLHEIPGVIPSTTKVSGNERPRRE